jgi:hypothetical protein
MSLHGGEANQSSTRHPNILANIDHISEKLAAKTANFSGPTPSGRSPKPFSIRWSVLLRTLVTASS